MRRHIRAQIAAVPSNGHNFRLRTFEVATRHKSLAEGLNWHVTCILRYVMETDTYLNAVRVNGEFLVLCCWACGTEHCMNVEQCTPEELPHLICSNSKCGTSMFLVNELTADDQRKRQKWTDEPSSIFAAFSWFRI